MSDASPSGDGGERAPELLDSRELCRTRIFEVHRDRVRLPSGVEQDWAVVRHGGAVAVAAVDARGRLLLVRQYRHATGGWLDEVVAGRLEPDEDPLEAARRELEEEAGLVAAAWERVTDFFPAPGFCSERITLFLATELASAGPDRRPPDPDEELEVLWRDPAEVLATSRDAKTLIAAAHLVERHAR